MPERTMELLFSPLKDLADYAPLCEAVLSPGTQMIAGLDDTQRLHLLAGVIRQTQKTMILILPSEQAAARAADDLTQLLGGGVATFPAREISFLRAAASSHELSMRRLDALGMAVTGRLRAIVLSADALMHRLMPVRAFTENMLTVAQGERLDPRQLMDKLVRAGYERVDTAQARGQCALRGGILDVYPVGQDNAVRIEFFDDEVDSLRDFDVMTQRSTARRDSVDIYPASEVLVDAQIGAQAAARLRACIDRGQNRAGDNDLAAIERQRALESEFDLIPFERFVEMIDAETDAPEQPAPEPPETHQPPKKDAPNAAYIMHTSLGRSFAGRIGALEDGRTFLGADALIHIIYPQTATLLDYFERPLVVLDQPDRLRERCENRLLEFEEHVKTAIEHGDAVPDQAMLLYTYDQLIPELEKHALVALSPFVRAQPDFAPQHIFKFEGVGMASYQGNMRELVRDIDRWCEDDWRVAILAGGVARGQRLNKALFELDTNVDFIDPPPETLAPRRPIILAGGLQHGFRYPAIKLAVVAESDVFTVSKMRSAKLARSGEKLAAFTDLHVGDYIVHENHGIGRYMGTVRLPSEGTYRDFLHIQYQGSDKLYVPTDQLDRVQKYIGSEGEMPKLNRLSGGEWQKQKARVRASIQAIAGDLVKLYAARTTASGHAFSKDTPWQKQFEDRFEYEETPDQIQAIDEIKQDMEAPKIMDRLLCGDVGYGKTEVALRAIFKCVMDGKQAALLAPTTILVQQHYATMLRRFDGFPVRVDTLSRFRTSSEQARTIAQLKAGELDVIIGTHRLLGKDIKFKDLGLLVVDEEQRFGVKHKEAIKQFKKNVDVLTLSATPIPRTLHMSMVGIRDMSLLRTPPEERYPVQTYVVEYSDGLVRDAILRELSRGGQVYVLHNRVETIDVMYQRLKKLVPEARIAVGHGQMREHALEDIMLDFYEGKFNVLLCTTIIEAGLDVPRANTLIVCDADRFGLAQLYQLRGRVGRSNRLAYAFLTVSPGKVLTESADKRLNAIREFTEFGSGFRVAMRDLEIRGTGNLLGAEQSGHMASVGYDLYVKMIDEAIRSLRGDISLGDIQTKIEIKVDAYLPSDYVSDDMTRVEMYKKIASIADRDSREDLIEELIDRFGDPGRSVMNLIEIAHCKALCQKLGVESVVGKGAQLVMRFAAGADLDVEKLVTALKKHEKVLKLMAGKESMLIYKTPNASYEDLLRGVVPVLEDIVAFVVGEAKHG